MGVKAKNRSNTTDPFSHYRNTLGTRYASPRMSALFSERHRAELWRQLWIYLADEERKLGLPISVEQVRALERSKTDIDFDRIREIEKKLKHDVMSHVKAYGEKAPQAEPILHLGATSAFITDNADVLIFKEAGECILEKLTAVIDELSRFMMKTKSLEMTGYTHFQPAQPVTLGKRASLWIQDLIWDAEEMRFALSRLQPLGCKGTTGTQASFMVLFNNDFKKVAALDAGISKRMGFSKPVGVSGQTLSRKVDVWFLQALSNMASSFSKLSYDMRLLQHLHEVMEPFGSDQVGSSAMPYKQNPMLAERLTGLSRFLMTNAQNSSWTHAAQWLERSLDDSSNRRLVVPECFLTADALCEIAYRLVKGLRVNQKQIGSHLSVYQKEFETEAAMMEGTLQGKSRQKLHEEIRRASLKGTLKKTKSRWRLSGAASEQVVEFYAQIVKPFLNGRKSGASSSKRAKKEAADLFHAASL